MSPYSSWVSKVSESDVLVAALGSGGVVTVDTGGYVRLWETGLDALQRSLMEWRNMIGSEDGRPIQVRLLCLPPPVGGSAALRITHTDFPLAGTNWKVSRPMIYEPAVPGWEPMNGWALC